MTQDIKNNRLWKGAFLLTIASLFGKVLSAFYRIPLQNLTGDMGFYVYQQIYPLIGMIFMFGLYGLPSAISMFMASHPKIAYSKLFFKQLFVILLVFCLFLFGLLYMSSPVLATWMGDGQLQRSLQYAAWLVLLIPVVTLFRGGLQGHEMMSPTAISQMIEQLIRTLIIITTAYLIFRYQLGVYQIADGAVTAAIVALVASSFYLYRAFSKHITLDQHSSGVDYWSLVKGVVFYGIIVSVNHMLLLFLQLADAFSIVPALKDIGYESFHAKEAKGVLDRGQPLLQLVTVVGSSVALALIPHMTKMSWQVNPKASLAKMRTAIRIGTYLSVGAAMGLLFLFPEINVMFFKNEAGTLSLRLLSLVVLFSAVTVIITSLLQMFGYIKITAVVFVVGFSVKWLLNEWLVSVFAISGAAVATVLTVGFLFLCTYYFLYRAVGKQHLFNIHWPSFLLACSGLLLSLIVFEQAFRFVAVYETRSLLFGYVLLQVLAGLFVYMFILWKTSGFTDEEKEILKKRK
ncbi:low temperature requirement B protein [Gracilibacillus halophilus YIM-C55.5]|uniref:Low temperature requirement B protein n=1 Tax=Gracilibacillus halophilus YIM-C55.5 TaxID=1308866 RepID=N4WND0_9BACI|nr:polysaccharide biosynthesis protein [Gracilibacillus halophilus]ENH97627.1 low temperature requirement B protein [Gracilibacillus halophilus YIM-C55.5]